MELALRLGRTLHELGETMSSYEFSMWCAYYRHSPWDAQRGDMRAGIVASTIANYAGMMRKPGSPHVSLADYMPFLQRDQHAAEANEEDTVSPLAHFAQFK